MKRVVGYIALHFKLFFFFIIIIRKTFFLLHSTQLLELFMTGKRAVQSKKLSAFLYYVGF